MVHKISRLEDMSPDGTLTLFRQRDGDIIVEITQGDDGSRGSNPGTKAQVEFCATSAGGGGSPKTLKALKNLMIAMAEDNAERIARRPKKDSDERLDAILQWVKW